jgi:hypothetical protein
VRLGRARHHRRIPLPGRLCCDPARSTSTCCRSHEASAGGPSCACVNRYFHDRADDGHIGLPAAVPSRQSHTREPTVPSGTARKSQIAITASPIRPHQNLQIPITSHLCPAGSCLGGFRTPAPCLSLDLRGPASENLHHHGHRLHDRRCLKAVVHPGDLNREQIVNSELEDEAATDRAEMMRLATDSLEDRLRMLEAGLVAAPEEDELAKLRLRQPVTARPDFTRCVAARDPSPRGRGMQSCSLKEFPSV